MMAATMSNHRSPLDDPKARISQLLPSVKCSTCNQPVPLDRLGDHACAAVPPVPALPSHPTPPPTLRRNLHTPSPSPVDSSPRPSFSSLTSPGQSSPLSRIDLQARSPISRPRDLLGGLRDATSSPAPSAGGRAPTPSNSAGQPILSRSAQSSVYEAASRTRSASSASHRPPGTTFSGATAAPRPSFVGTRSHSVTPESQVVRHSSVFNVRSPSAAPTVPSSSTSRPSFSSSRSQSSPIQQSVDTLSRRPSHANAQELYSSSNSIPPPRSPDMPITPTLSSNRPPSFSTQSGGEAGMAGVGRRAFAAAARAALFASSNGSAYRGNAPSGLDMSMLDSSSPATSSFSPNSVYSDPMSAASVPTPPPPPNTVPTPSSLSSPSRLNDRVSSSAVPMFKRSMSKKNTASSQSLRTPPTPVPASPALSQIRLPFIEKLKSKTIGPNSDHGAALASSDPPPRPEPPSERLSFSSDEGGGLAYADGPGDEDRRSRSNSTSMRSPRSRANSNATRSLADSPTTRSGANSILSRRGTYSRASPPPPLPVSQSILPPEDGPPMADSPTGVDFPLLPDTGDRVSRLSDVTARMPDRNTRTRGDSASSTYSSTSSDLDNRMRMPTRTRSSSSARVAHALGLTQTLPGSYDKMGGPGVGTRVRSGSSSSVGSRSTYSRKSSTHNPSGPGSLERLVEDSVLGPSSSGVADDGELTRPPPIPPSSRPSHGSFPGSVSNGKGSASNGSDTPGGTTTPQRSRTVQVPYIPEPRPPKLPVRARTSALESKRAAGVEHDRRSHAADGRRSVKKTHVCVRCSYIIEDGRWIRGDGGATLCERCWKQMYLPKCRRCNLTIEKHAVCSSDGQLKGKYHRECFNCHICQKPFPDKEFYVFDGKPMCKYHYHQENNSLCAAAACGQPVEGPCAVSHAGARYHPEHLLCEYTGFPPCTRRLEEYWEVDGHMLCEQHATSVRESGDFWMIDNKAMKRVTRFIDLTDSGSRPSSIIGGVQ